MIDISEIPTVYRNPNARLLYIHLALKADYRGENLDKARLSLCQLASGAGLTISAVRHGLKVLQHAGLVKRDGDAWAVTKWLQPEPARKRPKTAQEQQQLSAAEERQKREDEQERRHQLEKKRRADLLAIGHTELTYLYEQKLTAAADGDEDARRFCKNWRANYDKEVDELIKRGYRKKP